MLSVGGRKAATKMEGNTRPAKTLQTRSSEITLPLVEMKLECRDTSEIVSRKGKLDKSHLANHFIASSAVSTNCE